MQVLQAIASHWGAAVGIFFAIVAGALSTVGTFKNVMTRIEGTTGRRYPRVDSKVAALYDLLAWVAKYDHQGLIGPFTVPFFPSVPNAPMSLEGAPVVTTRTGGQP